MLTSTIPTSFLVCEPLLSSHILCYCSTSLLLKPATSQFDRGRKRETKAFSARHEGKAQSETRLMVLFWPFWETACLDTPINGTLVWKFKQRFVIQRT
jgi:hypothetical protein